jgi:hypothetical protein
VSERERKEEERVPGGRWGPHIHTCTRTHTRVVAVDLPPRLAALTESTGARIGGFVALVTSPPDAR